MQNLFNRLYAAETRLFRLNSALDKDNVRQLAAEQGLRAAQQRLAFGTVNGTVFGDRGGPPKVVGHVVGCNGLGYFGATVQLIDNSDHTTILGTRTTDTNGLADFGSPTAWPNVFDLAVVVPAGKRYAGVPAVGASAFPGVIELGFAPISPGDTVCTANGWYPATVYIDCSLDIFMGGLVTPAHPSGHWTYNLSGYAATWNPAYSVWVAEVLIADSTSYDLSCTPLAGRTDSTLYIAFSPTGSLTFSAHGCGGTVPTGDPGGNYPPANRVYVAATPTTSDVTNLIYTYSSGSFSGNTTNIRNLSTVRVDNTP